MIDWLSPLDAPFDASACPYTTSCPNNRYYLYYSGRENFGRFRGIARPVQRGHRANGPGASGKKIYRPLAAAATRNGVRTHETHPGPIVIDRSRRKGCRGAGQRARRRTRPLRRPNARITPPWSLRRHWRPSSLRCCRIWIQRQRRLLMGAEARLLGRGGITLVTPPDGARSLSHGASRNSRRVGTVGAGP